jgi:hypothetical protein
MTAVKQMPNSLPPDFGFEPQPAVRWLAPRVLASSALKVVLSGVFGAYADKRELQAAFPQDVIDDFKDRDQLWVDYVSDLGDGFNATYSIAWLLAQEKLDLPPGQPKRPGATPLSTQRGELLVMGGDEVYPVANSRAYENRTKGPYAAALPHVEGTPPVMVALPGNHDWYDGLTAFIRIFAQGESIGAWQTRQRRSYFALQLPNRWWLLGVDIQFNTYIDAPQLQYFKHACRDMQAGDAVILCSARPSWIHTIEDPEAFASLDYFERTIIAPTGASVRVWLSGDDHHYACFRQVDGERTLMTSGGGGAYLSPTHHVPEKLVLPPPNAKGASRAATAATFKRLGTYPWVPQSKRLAFGVWKLPWRNYGFASVIGFLQLLLLLTLGSGIATLPGMSGGFVDAIQGATLGEALTALIRPFALTILGVILAATVALSHTPGTKKGAYLGAAHGVAQVALGVGSLLAWGQAPFLDTMPKGWAAVVIGLGTLFGTGLVGSWLAAAYLLIADRLFDVNANEVFAAQSIEDHKSWVRMHIDTEGTLRLIPVKVERICRAWELGDESPGVSRLRPAPGQAPEPEMIHADPIVVHRA